MKPSHGRRCDHPPSIDVALPVSATDYPALTKVAAALKDRIGTIG